VERLLRHFLLDIDAAAWDPRTETLYDYGCLSAIRDGKIDLVSAEGVSPRVAPLQAAHIILVSHDTGFCLSERARNLVNETWRSERQEEVIAVLEDKRPGAAYLLRRHVEELLAGLPLPTAISL
jgi:hypothetical protein